MRRGNANRRSQQQHESYHSDNRAAAGPLHGKSGWTCTEPRLRYSGLPASTSAFLPLVHVLVHQGHVEVSPQLSAVQQVVPKPTLAQLKPGPLPDNSQTG